MLLAVSALVLSLLQQIEEASHAEPPVFQVETLLQTANLLPAGPERRSILDAAIRANAAVRDTESRAGDAHQGREPRQHAGNVPCRRA